MRRLKLLAISDTHLGEETSLLSFPRGLQHLWETFCDNKDFWKPIFGEDFDTKNKVEVEDLVLLGDTVDRTLSSTSQISANAHAFAMMMYSAFDIKRAIYVPGNHDHTLWTDFAEAAFERGAPAVTDPKGKVVVAGGKLLDEAAKELVSILLGYRIGWAWWEIEKGSKKEDFEFAVANPLYAKEINGRVHVFAHGTHFRGELITRWKRGLLRLGDVLNVDQRLAGLEIEPSDELKEAKGMVDLERIVAPFVDSLWPSSKNAPTARSDELWYLWTLFREGPDPGRKLLGGSRIFAGEELEPEGAGRIDQLTTWDNEPADESLKRFREYFLPHLGEYLADSGFPSSAPISFVYGDTHRGGFGNLSGEEEGTSVRIFNTGGWVVPAGGGHPACHLYAVDEEGKEYILDLSFNEVQVGDEALLYLAKKDLEHRTQAVDSGILTFGKTLRALQELW